MLSEYDILIDYFYETSLSWAYNMDNNPLPQEDIEQVLTHHKNLDMEAFLGLFYLWRYVTEKLQLPLPRLERIIPFMIS
jgi:hypothetical protein